MLVIYINTKEYVFFDGGEIVILDAYISNHKKYKNELIKLLIITNCRNYVSPQLAINFANRHPWKAMKQAYFNVSIQFAKVTVYVENLKLTCYHAQVY